MTIHGELTAEDSRTAEREKIRPVLPLFGLLAVLSVPQVFLGSHWQFPLPTLIFSGIFLLQYVVICGCSAEFYAKHLIRRDSPLGPRVIKCKPEGISITGPGVSRYIKLDKDIRFLQSYRDGLLIHAPFRAEAFPRHWFTTEEYTAFQDYLKKGQNWRGWISYLWRS